MIMQNILWALIVETFGVACTAGILYLYWSFMTKKKKED